MKYASLIPIFLAGCATAATLNLVEYRLSDDPSKQRIELSYENNSRKVMCLSADDWPNSAGKLNQAADQVALIVGGERYPIEDFNTGYCVGGCATVVQPGQTAVAYIPYKDFKIPERLYGATGKTIDFKPKAFECPANTPPN